MVDNMSSGYDCQAAVVESLHTSHKAKEIIEWFIYPKTMVYNLTKAYEASDNKISGQKARLIRSILEPSGHLSLLSMLSRLSRRTPAKA